MFKSFYYFERYVIEVFVNISLSYFNKAHTLRGNMTVSGSLSRDSDDICKQFIGILILPILNNSTME